jgi:hypothetical protein
MSTKECTPFRGSTITEYEEYKQFKLRPYMTQGEWAMLTQDRQVAYQSILETLSRFNPDKGKAPAAARKPSEEDFYDDGFAQHQGSSDAASGAAATSATPLELPAGFVMKNNRPFNLALYNTVMANFLTMA